MKNVVYFFFWTAFLMLWTRTAAGDAVTEWNSALLEAIKNESTSPPLAARNLALVHTAIFDAVNAIDRTYEPYLFRLDPPAGVLPEAVVIGAARESMTRLYPSQVALFDAALETTMATLPAGTNRDNGYAFGQLMALMTLAWRSGDGSSTTVPYIPDSQPGDWRRTPPFFRPPELPHWPYVVPFVLTNGTQFRPAGPPSLTSTQYTRDFELVKELGALNSATRTEEQTIIARFWSDFSFTVTPPGHWNQIAQNVATNGGNTLIQNARLFALLNLAMADAGIACWDAKYAYNFWRPVTAIREADTDGNPDTDAAPDWTPLLNTPPFPEYVSGHSTFSAAAAEVLMAFFGTDDLSFTVGSDSLPGVFRTYHGFYETAEEIGMSRIYGGIHFYNADIDGLALGKSVGQYVIENTLRQVAVPAGISITAGTTNDFVRIGVFGMEGQSFAIELSEDLQVWTPIFTNISPFEVQHPRTPRDGYYFYRAKRRDN